ncbi:TM2 domain-containing protein [Enterococcus lactis]|uniref:TM2 domain-containing protein n=1 Tax=Enterococcus TaxID=1350 RepID=UPI001C8B62DF|nr:MULTISPECIES: NINE protein [Enterococcus]MBX9042096.1 NINE protein [Enterococcus durans]MBX9078618.1 NINE protein [Enterococcus durans]
MAKIVKLEQAEVIIATDEKEIIRVPYEELDWRPEVHDEVEVFKDGDSLIITRVKNNSNSAEDKIHINIVNDNTQNQQVSTIQSGRVVNKLIYVLLALFLGGLGAHKFYSGKTFMGILYLVFSWTFIPSVLGLIEAIIGALKPSDSNGNIVF